MFKVIYVDVAVTGFCISRFSLLFLLWGSFNKIRWISPREMAIKSRVYRCNVFKEINWEGSFHFQKDFQHDLLIDPYARNFFLRTVFFTQAVSGKHMISPIVTIFGENMHQPIHHTYFFKMAYGLQYSATKNIMTYLCSNRFVAILNRHQKIIFEKKKKL